MYVSEQPFPNKVFKISGYFVGVVANIVYIYFFNCHSFHARLNSHTRHDKKK